MKQSIRERKRQFLSFMLVLLMVLEQLSPIAVFAASFDITYDMNTGEFGIDTEYVRTGDIISFEPYNSSGAQIRYCDYETDSSFEWLLQVDEATDDSGKVVHTVKSYSEVLNGTEGKLDPELFGGWRVSEIVGSSGYVYYVVLTAEPSVESAITYELDGGVNSADNPSSYKEGEGAELLPASKEGYTFAGWYTDASFTEASLVTRITETQTGDITLYAKFAANTYSIDYVLDGGENAASNPAEYTYGTGIKFFANASKLGYTFMGWYSDTDYSIKVTEITATQQGNMTLYARFEADKYNITYDLDGGENAASNPAEYTYGTGIKFFANASKLGYTFMGWYSDTDYSINVTEITATQQGDITLYARFEADKYNITYDLDGGENSDANPTEYTYGIGVAEFKEATKTGYTFEGWYTDNTYTTQVTSISATEIGNVKLYAKFTANTYSIDYDLDGGINSDTNPTEYTYGIGVAEFKEATKTGYTFEGWYSDAEFKTPVTGITAETLGNVKLYAKFTANTYSIEYDLDGGVNSDVNPAEYTYGVGVEKLEDATKIGYTFEGWYTDNTYTTQVTSIPATEIGNVKLYAKFTANTYSIDYVLDGGENAASNPAEYTYGTGIKFFANASKLGYTFMGWYSDTDYSIKVTEITATQQGNMTLYARFEADKYNITYDLDGGVNSDTNPTEYTYGIGVAELKEATKTGYTFEGWYSDAEFKTPVTGITATEIGNVKLYAKFTANIYSIDYDLDGGVNSDANPTEYTYGIGVAELKEATKTGYTFEGWYTDNTYTTQVTGITATEIGNVKLYAKFTANTYSIDYVLDGGVNSDTNPIEYTYGTGIKFFANASKLGYTFMGWYSDTDYSIKVTEITATQQDNITLYARFEADKYNITYDLDGGVNSDANPTEYTYGVGVEKLEDATKTGHTFEGWYSDAEFKTQVTGITATEIGNVKLYAKFTANTYSIEYDLDGGVNSDVNPAEYTYGTGIKFFANASKLGYTFMGWYSDTDYSIKVTEITATQQGNITLYARFEADKYNITYDLDGGVNSDTNPAEYTYGVGVEKLEDATKTGYTFEGWYSDAEFKTPVTGITADTLGNVKLYAKFTANIYSIEYDLDGGENSDTNPTEYTYGVGVAELKEATKTGYTFEGWYSDAEFKTLVTGITADTLGNIKLYAKFTANTYSIEYDLDGGVNSDVNPIEYTYGVGVAELKEATKTGYTFEGWYSDAEFKTLVTGITAETLGNIKLYAKFTANTYSIDYVLDGGENAASNPTEYTYGTGIKFFANASKLGYTFMGWYSGTDYSIKVTEITATQQGNITLYARFEADKYNITYDLDGGVNADTNPTEYTYGIGVAEFKEATKTGYTFEGWYSDAEFRNQVTAISAAESGNKKLYAKFTWIVVAGTASAEFSDIYFGETIEPKLESETNGTSNVTIKYKKKGEADSTYTTEEPKSAGEYDVCVIFAATDRYFEVVVTDTFSILKREGSGSISISDSFFGTEIGKTLESTNGTDNVKIEYKKKGADDSSYSETVPTEVGDYTIRVTFPETDGYLSCTDEADFSIIYPETPDNPFVIEGTEGEKGFYKSTVTVTPAEGYLISDSLDGEFKEKLEITDTASDKSIYLKKKENGEITAAISLPDILIDDKEPVIQGAQSGDTIYGEASLTVEDENLEYVYVNGEEVPADNGRAVISLTPSDKEESYTIVAADKAGNKKEISIIVAPEWMRTRIITAGWVYLYEKYTYQLGDGKWKVSDKENADDTIYSGNVEINVEKDGYYYFEVE